MHFNNGFALRWISIKTGVGAALLTKLRFKRNAKKTFGVNFKEEIMSEATFEQANLH